MSLQGKRILIVGGMSGFGAAVAEQAVAAGGHVHVIGHSPARLQQFQATHPAIAGTALAAQAAAPLTAFFARHAAFDHVVSLLGGAMGGGFLANDLATIRAAIEGKFFANLQLAQIAVPQLRAHGSLVFTSGAGVHPAEASGAIVGNHALNDLVRGLAVEAAPRLRVNAVAPTWTPTGLWRGMTADAKAAQAKAVAAGLPLRRVATTAEVAGAYLFLLTNTFVTGQILHVDGDAEL